jgi:hypothetical protein
MKNIKIVLLTLLLLDSLKGESLEKIQDLVFENPTDIELNFKLIEIAKESRDYDTVIATLERLIILDDTQPQYYVDLIDIYNELNMSLYADMTIDEAIEAGFGESSQIIRARERVDDQKDHFFIDGSFRGGYGYSSNPLYAPTVKSIREFFEDEHIIILDHSGIEPIIEDAYFQNYSAKLGAKYDLGLVGGFYSYNYLLYNSSIHQNLNVVDSENLAFSTAVGYSSGSSDTALSFITSSGSFGGEKLYSSYGGSLKSGTTLPSSFKGTGVVSYTLYDYYSRTSLYRGAFSLYLSKGFREIENFQIGFSAQQSSGEELFDSYSSASISFNYGINGSIFNLSLSGSVEAQLYEDDISAHQKSNREDFKESLALSLGAKNSIFQVSLNYIYEKSISNVKYMSYIGDKLSVDLSYSFSEQ